MYLKRLSLINFKNIAQTDLVLGEGINCFTGDNGAGKTNVLDAVYVLSMSKSATGMTDGQCVRHGENFYVAEGEYFSSDGRREQIACSFMRGSGKTLKRNGKVYERLSDHVGLIPIVIVVPSDTMLISDAADERRRYLNSFISQFDRSYLEALMRYNAVLAERNRFLKTSSDESMLEVYDAQLAAHGTVIHARRAEILERLQPVVAEYYEALSPDGETIDLRYRSELNEAPFADILLRARQKDAVNEFTTSGVHRDDIVFSIGGQPLRRFGSQGQQKSFLIALKLAQYSLISEISGERPILLLDDVCDKLDEKRVERLAKLVSGERFGQIFITDCNEQRLRSLLERADCEYSHYAVREGEVRI
ncbi:MAG: DNA replication/repair protein RecF [Alistipes sp.]|nr:DNA replication/repair protein RecF [Alistipes sp.]